MYKLIAKAVEHRKITIFLTVVIAITGLYAYYLLPRQESPQVAVPVAVIVTPYPGAPATDVRELVTKKIENELENLDGYDYCKGISKENVSVVTVFFKVDTDNDAAMQNVRNAVADVQPHLPQGALASTVNTDIVSSAGILISISGENYSYDQLASFGDRFKNKLRAIDGISKIDLIGKLNKEVKVDLDIGLLNQLDLSVEDVCKILAAQNVQIPSGSIDYQTGKISVNTPGNYTSVADIKNTIISVSPTSGVVTKLKDIARVEMEIEDGAQKIKADHSNAVLLAVYFVDHKNIVITGKEVRRAMDAVKAQLPPDLMVNEIVYQPDAVSESTNDFMLHLLIGMALVLAAVFGAMGVRNALVVSTAIPLSILFTFIMMYIFGVQLHKVSLAALIVALGILVDDAIVVADNVQVRIDAGDEPGVAAYNGAVRCTIPNFCATTAIMVAFAPLLGIPGGPGQFMHALPWVVIVSVAASYFVAMLTVPAVMAGYAPVPGGQRHPKLGRIRFLFQKLLGMGLRYKKQTVACVMLALVLVLVLVLPRLAHQFFPYTDKDIFYIQINSEKTGDLATTESLADEVVQQLNKMPEIESCTVSIGNGLPKFYITMTPPLPADDFAQVAVKFNLEHSDQFASNVELARHVQSLLDQNVSGGRYKVKLLEYAIPIDAKVVVRLTSPDINQLVKTAEVMKQHISNLPGTMNIRDNWDADSLQLSITLDEDKASSQGISKYDVQKEINAALYGYHASVFRKDGNEYQIKVKGDIKDTADLGNFAIKSSFTGHKLPLKEFATITYGPKTNTINTYNGDLAIDILADPVPGYDATRLENQIEATILPQIDLTGVDVNFFGEREDIRENFTAMGVLAVIAVLATYIILLLIFKSFIQPLVILITIPLSLIGSLTGLFIFKQPMSLTALLGVVALIGLVVKNGVLLLDFINEERDNGHPVDEACMIGVNRRFNAVFISAFTIVLALIPLALSGSNLFSPMAVALMSGLTVATFLTMVVVPVIYSIVEK